MGILVHFFTFQNDDSMFALWISEIRLRINAAWYYLIYVFIIKKIKMK